MQQPAAVIIIRGLFLATLIIGVLGCGGRRTVDLVDSSYLRPDVQTWDCGADSGKVTATLKDDGAIIVRGMGAMMDYDGSQVPTPWHALKDSITKVIIEDGVTSVGKRAFGDCAKLTYITIAGSVTAIGDFAFAGSAAVTIPSSVLSIGMNALSRTASINVEADNPNYSSVGGVLFNKAQTVLIQYPQSKKDTSYTIPNSVTSIGDDAFANCGKLASVKFGSGVTTIGEFAFAFCHSLKSVTIPDNVTRIGWGAFAHSGLTSVTSLNPVPPETIGKSPFLDIDKNACLYVPEESIGAYRAADHWKDFECIEPKN